MFPYLTPYIPLDTALPPNVRFKSLQPSLLEHLTLQKLPLISHKGFKKRSSRCENVPKAKDVYTNKDTWEQTKLMNQLALLKINQKDAQNRLKTSLLLQKALKQVTNMHTKIMMTSAEDLHS